MLNRPSTETHSQTADNYKLSAEEDGISDPYTSIFMRMTISNIRQGSPRLWCGAEASTLQRLSCAMQPVNASLAVMLPVKRVLGG